MHHFLRWWETLGRAERIIALSIGLSAPIAIISSTVWAIASAYMVHERSRVEIERLHAQVAQAALPSQTTLAQPAPRHALSEPGALPDTAPVRHSPTALR